MLTPKIDFFETSDGLAIIEQLKAMCASEIYATKDSYSPHSDNPISFLEKHQDFIRKHPATNAHHYVANLKIMCRLR